MARSLRNLTMAAAACALAATVSAGRTGRGLSFEQVADRSDRVVSGVVSRAIGERVTVTNPETGYEATVVLGVFDAEANMVFSRYTLDVDTCVYDRHGDCPEDDVELRVPGGTVWETHDGDKRLVTTRVSDISSAPPAIGEEYVYFLREAGRRSTYYIVPARRARLKVDRSTGEPRVALGHGSRLQPRPSPGETDARRAPPAGLDETVTLERLGDLVRRLKRQPPPR